MTEIEAGRLADAEAALGEALGIDWHPDVAGLTPDDEGLRLWQQAVARVQQSATDDRFLYWQRLATAHAFRINGFDEDQLTAFERSSRGFDSFTFEGGGKRIAVTGFDPFHLDTNIEQGNPSGLVALQLDGQRIGDAQIKTLLIPVRFADFDNDLIEGHFRPLMEEELLDMIITVSMGRTDFDLERFPGLRRSSGNPDNCRALCGGTAESPLVPPGLEGPEFVEFSLPVEAMGRVAGDFAVNDNRTVTTVESGEFEAFDIAELATETAVRGSGGGYLSNEIAYRIANLRDQLGKALPVGHIHTPRMPGFDAGFAGAVTKQTRSLIEAAVSSLP